MHSLGEGVQIFGTCQIFCSPSHTPPHTQSNHKICAPLCQVHWGAKPPLSGVLANSSKAVARAPPRLLLPPPTPVAQQQQQKLSTQPGQFQKDGPGLIGGKRQLAGSGKEPGAAKGGEWAAGSAMEGHTGGRRLDGTSTDQEAEASLPPLSPEGNFVEDHTSEGKR
eukprot:1158705-Pelagomonas_calceolata.AAC.12